MKEELTPIRKKKGEKLREIVDLMYHLDGGNIIYVNNKDELDYRIERIMRWSRFSRFKNSDNLIETYRFCITFHSEVDFETFEKANKEHSNISFYKNNDTLVVFNSDFLEPAIHIKGKWISFKDEEKYPAISQINKYLEIKEW